MIIQIDSREKSKAIQKIIAEFDNRGIKHPVSKLMVGDYMNYDNPRLIIDRKQNLLEICSNVCQDHDRFRKELILARDNEIQLVILCEHGDDIECLEDIIFWENPRREVKKRINGKWVTTYTNAMKGDTLYKILTTLEYKYGVRFEFCKKEDTGKRIVEILGGEFDTWPKSSG